MRSTTTLALFGLLAVTGCDGKFLDGDEEETDEGGDDGEWSDADPIDGGLFGGADDGDDSDDGGDATAGTSGGSGGGGASSDGGGSGGDGTGGSGSSGTGGDEGEDDGVVGLDDGGGDESGGGSVRETPVAVCDVSPDTVRPISDSATWIGEDSYDPGEASITYDWTLAYRPDGSAAEMPSGSMTSPNRAEFTADLAGEYVGRLVVTNDSGYRSDPCEVTLIAEPAEALWVEMFWESGGDDMDLHLLSPDASMEDADGDGLIDGLKSDQDCYYANCTVSSWSEGLDWGVSGETIDDPALDLDDISETGPENINIEMPVNGIYTVIVHDYPGSVYEPGNPVTVNIYLDGALEWTEMRVIDVEDSYTEFAEINTTTGEVTSL